MFCQGLFTIVRVTIKYVIRFSVREKLEVYRAKSAEEREKRLIECATEKVVSTVTQLPKVNPKER